MATLEWLPPLVPLSDYDGDWNRFVEAIYRIYKHDFVEDPPSFARLSVRRQVLPVDQGKEATFWHLISEGPNEENRTPDLRRCERIRWPRPIIAHSGEPPLKVWQNVRDRGPRVCIWLEDIDYLVILARRERYVVLLTAYPVTRAHHKEKLRREYEAYTKTKAAPY